MGSGLMFDKLLINVGNIILMIYNFLVNFKIPSFDFYRNCFDFLFSILRCKGDKYVLDKNGEEYNKFRRINILQFARYVDQQKSIRIRITEGNESSNYDSWEIIEME